MDIEHYSDPLDVASRNTDIANEDAIRNNARASEPYQRPDGDGHYAIHDCLECGEPIGEQRIKVAIKNVYCVDCATEMEREGKGRR